MTPPKEQPLEACPWCGSEKLHRYFRPDSCSIHCLSCEAQGSWFATQENAITAWNGGVLRQKLAAAEARVRELETILFANEGELAWATDDGKKYEAKCKKLEAIIFEERRKFFSLNFVKEAEQAAWDAARAGHSKSVDRRWAATLEWKYKTIDDWRQKRNERGE